MARDDLDVIAYKVLKYIDGCSKAGVAASAEKLQGVTEVMSKRRIAEAVEGLVTAGYVTGVAVDSYYDGSTDISFPNPRVTIDGAEYLKMNPAMVRAAEEVKGYFPAVLETVVRMLSNIT